MSGLPFELLLGLRYLRPKRTAVSVITLISVLGVTLGVAVLIIVISVMTGFDHDLRDKILGFNPHLRIVEHGRTIHDYEALMRLVASNRNVKTVAPYVFFRVLLETQPVAGQAQFDAPLLLGIDPKRESNLSSLATNIDGKFDLNARGLVVGTNFAHDHGLSVGDRVLLYSPEEIEKWRERMERWRKTGEKEGEQVELPPEYEVRGIFDVGYYEYDSQYIIASLEDAQELCVLGTSVHGLIVTLKNAYDASDVADEFMRTLGPKYDITTWMEENANLLGALVVEKNMMFYLLFFIMIVAALCILSALITFVVQKTREIGMLKALGSTDLQVAGLFLSQSGFIGAMGVAAGFGLGRLAIAYRNEFLLFMRRVTGAQLFPESIYMFKELPALVVPGDILLICGSAFLICLLGGVIPAWRAGRLKPVEALRYE
jgi:lipoprotein-releasing system permease protein